MDWNKTYTNGRDYLWMPTQSLTLLLEEAGFGAREDMQAHGRALDIGCGTGQLARDLYHRGFSVTGIDTSEAAVAIAQASTVKAEDLTFMACDITKAPLGQAFELITAKYVIAFIEDKKAFLSNVRDSLSSADGATFVVITPRPETLPAHKQGIAIAPDELMPLLEAYFSSVRAVEHAMDTWHLCRK